MESPSSCCLRNVGILPHHCTVSQNFKSSSSVLCPHFRMTIETQWFSETLVSYHTTTRRQRTSSPGHLGYDTVYWCEDGGSVALRSGILPYHCTASQNFKSWSFGLWNRVMMWNGGRMAFRNDGILPHHYTTSQPKRPLLESSIIVMYTVLRLSQLCVICLWKCSVSGALFALVRF